MRRLILTALTAALALALGGVGGGSARPAQYDPNAYCCVDAIRSVAYAPSGSLTVNWQPPDSELWASEVHVGYTVDAKGVVDFAWAGNIGEANGGNRTKTSVFPAGADYTSASSRSARTSTSRSGSRAGRARRRPTAARRTARPAAWPSSTRRRTSSRPARPPRLLRRRGRRARGRT